ncbi:MAG: glycosyltransferase family 4 protein, partial [Bacteroidetes bacterium]|nr:glycosyltransferase family 4 protein [Bacteroidota bacterium]
MVIGFDAKRAFHNRTGLGHYSRTLLRDLSRFYPEQRYLLFNPKPSSLFDLSPFPSLQERLPETTFDRLLPALWRSSRIIGTLKEESVQLYHGLSHELPQGIERGRTKTVVTMHDLIHERYPEQYPWLDRKIYTRKFQYACDVADTIIAISEQTKNDLIDFYMVPAEKIKVCYQSCNPAFAEKVSEAEKARVRKIYDLPDRFFLYVGSVIERKNLLSICKAMDLLRDEIDIPLVVIGEGKKYLQQVKAYVEKVGLSNRIIFLSAHPAARQISFQNASDFPAIYQLATAMIYPSMFEGFGIPVLEALWSGLPVITSNISSLPEAGGDAALYVNPAHPEEIAA